MVLCTEILLKMVGIGTLTYVDGPLGHQQILMCTGTLLKMLLCTETMTDVDVHWDTIGNVVYWGTVTDVDVHW